jgi:hypothetical protein
MDLTEFLAARLNDDEAAAKAMRNRWDGRSPRMLHEVEAKRAILALHPMGAESHHGEVGYICGLCEQRWPCATLRALAAVYSDHEDYSGKAKRHDEGVP